MVSPTSESIRPRFFRMRKSGMMMRITGMIWLTKIHPVPILRAKPRARARTYAPGTETANTMTVEARETPRLLAVARTSPRPVKASR
jgi:hypothetical protein